MSLKRRLVSALTARTELEVIESFAKLSVLKRFWHRLRKLSVAAKRCSKCGLIFPIECFDERFDNEKRSGHALFFKGKWYIERRAECDTCKRLLKNEAQELRRLVRLP